MDTDLSNVSEGDITSLGSFYDSVYPGDVKLRRAQNLGQISRFVWNIEPGDVVVTPMLQSEYLLIGVVDSPYYYEVTPDCPYGHRRRVKWATEQVLRSSLPVPLQNTLRATLTVFEVRPPDELLKRIGREPPKPGPVKHVEKDISTLVLERLLALDHDEFEILITNLLTALGFEAEHTGKTGDGGVDVQGTLNVYNFATVDLNVQVKRYKLGSTISHKTVRDFRASVPEKVQATFVTTSTYTQKAREEAEKEGFKKIGLIDGGQLVDILVEEYEHLPLEVREKLGLRRVLVPS
jgi:restriction system protein